MYVAIGAPEADSELDHSGCNPLAVQFLRDIELDEFDWTEPCYHSAGWFALQKEEMLFSGISVIIATGKSHCTATKEVLTPIHGPLVPR